MANGTAFFPILKSEKQEDGTLKVWGKATGPDLDLDAQICDPKWLEQAMPDWMKWGNVREQHTSIAAGVGLTLEKSGDDWNLESLVVDPGSVAKVETGVLKGYSIGIRNPKVVKDAAAPGGRITGGTIVEVSLVDRPANPTCTLMLSKSAEGDTLTWVEKDLATEADEASLVEVARSALAALLASEAAEVGDRMGSTGVVAVLLSILDDLDLFTLIDTWDDEDAAMLAGMKSALLKPGEGDMTKTTLADIVKAVQADDASEDDKTAVAELRKVLGVDDAVETATKSAEAAEAKALATEETVKGLVAELAKARAELDGVKEMAAPGGPVRIRTEADSTKAAALDRANALEAKALQVTDPMLREGYRQLAAEARAAAA